MELESLDAAFVIDMFLFLLIGIGPKIALVPFLETTKQMPEATKRRVLRKMLTTATTVAVLLLILGGLMTRLLHFSPGALGVASGIILLIIAVTLGLVAFQYWLFERTLLGKKLQATSQDKEMAALLGIPVAAMIMITFVYSAVLGGIAGILVAPVLFVSIQMGSTIALKAFAATIIGGFGDVAGAILGGFAIGIIETFGAAYISVPFKDAFAFLVLILFLALRPQGIFGERVAEKA